MKVSLTDQGYQLIWLEFEEEMLEFGKDVFWREGSRSKMKAGSVGVSKRGIFLLTISLHYN